MQDKRTAQPTPQIKNTSLPPEPAQPDCESASDGRHDRARAKQGEPSAARVAFPGAERSRALTTLDNQLLLKIARLSITAVRAMRVRRRGRASPRARERAVARWWLAGAERRNDRVPHDSPTELKTTKYSSRTQRERGRPNHRLMVGKGEIGGRKG